LTFILIKQEVYLEKERGGRRGKYEKERGRGECKFISILHFTHFLCLFLSLSPSLSRSLSVPPHTLLPLSLSFYQFADLREMILVDVGLNPR